MNRLMAMPVIVLLCGFATPSARAQSFSLQELGGELAADSSPVRIYAALDIITMDPRKPRAEAVAVQDGKFLAVGSFDEVLRAAGDDPSYACTSW